MAAAAAITGAYKVRPSPPALTPFKVAIAGRRAALARRENVRVHARHMLQPGFAPVEASSR